MQHWFDVAKVTFRLFKLITQIVPKFLNNLTFLVTPKKLDIHTSSLVIEHSCKFFL